MESVSLTEQKKVLVLGDSLTFGRPKYHISNDDTWPSQIEASGFRVFHRGMGGASSKSVLDEARHLYGYMIDEVSNRQPPFDLCFIQVGIVDYTPRLLSQKLHRVIGVFPGGGRVVAALSRFGPLIRLVGKPWVSLVEFQRNVMNILDLCSKLAADVVFIEIAKPAHFLIDNCGDFSGVVHQYNSVLRDASNDGYLPVFENLDLGDLLLPDGHHLTKDGHKRIAQQILNYLSNKS